MNLSNLCRLTYSHSDYSDVWPIYFGEIRRFDGLRLDHYLACDKHPDSEHEFSARSLLYDERSPYPVRLMSCLNRLTDYEYILFDHEDMILYAQPDTKALSDYIRILKSEAIHSIRLIKAGKHLSRRHPKVKSLHILITRLSPWIFSIQPTLWHRESLIRVLSTMPMLNIWEFERNIQKNMRRLGQVHAYSHENGKKRGMYHYDNSIYPYIATAIVKGKWNLSEYPEELSSLFRAYNIDPRVRGVN